MQKQPSWKLTMDNDLARRSADIDWPEGFSPDEAKIFSRTETRIHASGEKIWQHLVQATKWSEWYPDAHDVRIVEHGESDLQHDTVFQWTTFGLRLESKVHTYKSNSQIGWFAYTPGDEPTFYHVWHVAPQSDGSFHVITEEVGVGSAATYMRQTDEGLMHRGHEMWLATLKWVSEDK